MSSDQEFFDELYVGLKAMAGTSFPKKCANCGKSYETVEQFLSETERVRQSVTGLKSAIEDDGSVIVELFRNCSCGSTMMDFFGDRRDVSEAGLRRRKKFDDLLVLLKSHGIEHDIAKVELLKIMRGSKSEVIEKIRSGR
jgi:hypothetical protein